MKELVHESFPDEYHDTYSRTVFGFWLYLLSDLIFFGALFAVYAVLRGSTFGGPSIQQITHLPFTMFQTLILLISSMTAGFGGASIHRKKKVATIVWFLITFLLGAVFFIMELADMIALSLKGNGWEKSAFLSGYFTVIGTHALHMVFALCWTIVLVCPLLFHKISAVHIRRLTCLRMFWQFVNIVWFFIFVFVYLLGVKG